MKRRKLLAVLMAGVLSLLTLAGCGTKQAVPEDDAKVTVKLWLKPSPEASKGDVAIYEYTMQKLSEKFPGIKIIDESLKPGTDYRQEYDKALMVGNAPTAVDFFAYSDIPARIKNGTIAEITDLYNSWADKDLPVKVFDEAISKDNKWYAFVKSSYVMGTLYNKKAILEGGGDPSQMPTTWEEFSSLGQKVSDPSVPRFGYAMVGMDWCAWPYTAWTWSAGGDMVRPNEDGTYKLTFTEEPGVDAAEFMNQMIWKYKMTQKDVLQDWGQLNEDLISGRACFGWTDIMNITQEQLDKYGGDLNDYGFIPMPVKDSSIQNPTLSGGEVVTFNPKASKEELKAAWDIFTYIYFDEEYLRGRWALANEKKVSDLQIPANATLYKEKLDALTFVPQSIKDDLLEGKEVAIAEPYCPNWTEIKADLVIPLQTIMLKEGITREEISQILNEAADSIYKKYPEPFKK